MVYTQRFSEPRVGEVREREEDWGRGGGEEERIDQRERAR